MEILSEAHPGLPKPLDDAIAEYLMACEVEGKSPRTVQAYEETLRVFRRIVAGANLPVIVGGFAAADVYRFLKAIMDSPVSLGTRHSRFRETRAFFSWCTRMGYVTKHPFTGIPNVKVEQKVIQPFTEDEIQQLLAACDGATAFGCRNRAIILLFLDTGMRALELLRVEVDDVNWETRRIHVRQGKGRKQRVVPFGEGPEAALRDYTTRFRGEEPGCLFLATRGARRPLAPFALTTLFDRLGRRAGVPALATRSRPEPPRHRPQLVHGPSPHAVARPRRSPPGPAPPPPSPAKGSAPATAGSPEDPRRPRTAPGREHGTPGAGGSPLRAAPASRGAARPRARPFPTHPSARLASDHRVVHAARQLRGQPRLDHSAHPARTPRSHGPARRPHWRTPRAAGRFRAARPPRRSTPRHPAGAETALGPTAHPTKPRHRSAGPPPATVLRLACWLHRPQRHGLRAVLGTARLPPRPAGHSVPTVPAHTSRQQTCLARRSRQQPPDTRPPGTLTDQSCSPGPPGKGRTPVPTGQCLTGPT